MQGIDDEDNKAKLELFDELVLCQITFLGAHALNAINKDEWYGNYDA